MGKFYKILTKKARFFALLFANVGNYAAGGAGGGVSGAGGATG